MVVTQLGVHIRHFRISCHVGNNVLADKDGRRFCASPTHVGRTSRRSLRPQRVQTAKCESNIPATSFLVSTTHPPNPSSICFVHVTGRQQYDGMEAMMSHLLVPQILVGIKATHVNDLVGASWCKCRPAADERSTRIPPPLQTN